MRTVIIVSTLIIALVLGGCGSSDAPPDGPSPATTIDAAAAAGIPPTPDAATAGAFIAELNAIDPDIVHGKPDVAISRARSQCSSVAKSPTDQTELVRLTQVRFTAPRRPDGFDAATATKILATVRKHICPTW